MRFCQSCGMPMEEKNDFGTNQDGTLNEEYCQFCFEDGDFCEMMTMEEMIEHCLEYLDEFNEDAEMRMSESEARLKMTEFFPTLKRWRGVSGELN